MSQCDQLAALLSDGRWWSCRELLREVPCTVHSRIADLRKRGYVIEHETVGVGAAGSRYRLLSERDSEGTQGVARASRSLQGALDGTANLPRSESSPSFSAGPYAERDAGLTPQTASIRRQGTTAHVKPSCLGASQASSALTTPAATSLTAHAAGALQLTLTDAVA